MIKKQEICFKGANYKEDCGIYVHLSEPDKYPNAKLWPSGVMIEITLEEVEAIRNELQRELGHTVKTFKRTQA